MGDEWSQVTESNQFIVPSSQIESQSDIIENNPLPALAKRKADEESEEYSEVVYPVIMDPSGAGDPSGSLILVTDSEVESVERGGISSDAHVVEETVAEDNGDSDVVGSLSSDDAANVTVIAKGNDQRQEEDPASQDLFANKRDSNRLVGTPSQTMPSLQLSGSAMLVPETVEESLGDQEICPSPDAYDSMPVMIPSTPTASQTSVVEGQGEFTPGSAQTLRSLQKDEKLFDIMDMDQSQGDAPPFSASQPGGSFVGPTLAGESVTDWQQSQSLRLHLTCTSSNTQRSTQHQGSQPKSPAAAASQKNNSDPAMFGESQDLHLQLSPSQAASQPLQQTGAFSLSVPKPGSGWVSSAAGGPASEKALSQSAVTSSSKETSGSRNSGSPSRPAMSISMVHSESQSASETMFKLERPDISGLSEQAGATEVSVASGAGAMNVFQRTRQGKKAVDAHTVLPDDSEDFFPDKKQSQQGNVVLSLSDSDPIPCSQKRLPQSSPKQQAKGIITAKSEEEVVMEVSDAYNIDTVMDSEPEEEESTQSYEAFPALSGKLSTTPVTADRTEEQTEPQLLPITVSIFPPQAPALMSQRSISPAQRSQPCSSQIGQPLHSPTRQLSQRLETAASQQQRQSNVDLQDVSAAQLSHQKAQKSSQNRPVSSGTTAGSSQQRLLQPQHTEETSQTKAPSLSPEFPCSKTATDPSVKNKSPSQPVKGSSQIAVISQGSSSAPQPDPYQFHGSQSQLVKEEAPPTITRIETSATTLQVESKTKGRRKVLVKKKPEEKDKGSSNSTDGASESVVKTVAKPTRKAKRGAKFTKIVPAATDEASATFKEPARRAGRKSKEGVPEASNIVIPHPVVSVNPSPVSILAAPVLTAASAIGIPLAMGSGEPSNVAGGSQDGLRLAKRKSVEFSNTIQIGPPTHIQQISMEHSLSDSQSSDTLLEVTKVTEYIKRYFERITTVQLINKDGQVVQERTSREEGDHEVIEENKLCKKRRLSVPLSPSRSNSTLTSGDLGDISSSSLSARGLSGPGSSLERASSLELSQQPVLPSALAEEVSAPATAGGRERRSLVGRSSAAASPGTLSFLSPMQSSIEREDSRLDAVVTSSSSGRGSESLFSTDNANIASDVPCVKPTATNPNPASTASSSLSLSSGIIPPTDREESAGRRGKRQTSASAAGSPTKSAARSPRKSTRRAAADSSQEEKQLGLVSSASESQAFTAVAESGGFSIGGLTDSKKKSSASSLDSGDRTLKQQVESTRANRRAVPGSGSSTETSESASLTKAKQEPPSDQSTAPAVVRTISRLDIGARVMCRWKDGFFYPATFIGLNTGIGNKFKVVFEDGFEKTVRAVDLVMAQNIPTGHSVLVVGEDGASDPGIIVGHITDCPQFKEKGEVMYEIDMDNGTKKRCKRSDLLLTEDQASILLSEEEFRASFGEGDMTINTADVSLDNVILGKRLRIKGSPAVGVPRQSRPGTSTALSEDEDQEVVRDPSPRPSKATRGWTDTESSASKAPKTREISASKTSARKRKMGPVATSTPTPKMVKTSSSKQETPKKVTLESFSPLGAAVASPENQKRPARKARVGLFDSVKGPIPSSPIFAGCVFVMTHVIKARETLAEEKRQLQSSSVDSSTEGSADDESSANNVPFDKEHLKAQIVAGGGTVLKTLDSVKISTNKKVLYCISDTYQRTVKYFQCLASNIPVVSHLWIRDSCVQNNLLDYKSYVLPAGISLEKHKLMERNFNLACLNSMRVLVASSKEDYVDVWSSILELSGCKVTKKFAGNASKYRLSVDVVLADHTCPQKIVDKADSLSVPLVSSEWVIQCLINNEIMNKKGHPKYVYDFYKDLEAAYKSGSQS